VLTADGSARVGTNLQDFGTRGMDPSELSSFRSSKRMRVEFPSCMKTFTTSGCASSYFDDLFEDLRKLCSQNRPSRQDSSARPATAQKPFDPPVDFSLLPSVFHLDFGIVFLSISIIRSAGDRSRLSSVQFNQQDTASGIPCLNGGSTALIVLLSRISAWPEDSVCNDCRTILPHPQGFVDSRHGLPPQVSA
jgi:hypothetical protein